MRPESREDDRGRKSEEVGDITHEEASFEEQYREAAISCFRYLGFTSFEQVDRLTIAQYEIMMEALRYRIIQGTSASLSEFCCPGAEKIWEENSASIQKIPKFLRL
mgnify:CR=1 FL=1